MMMHETEGSPMIPKVLRQIAAGTDTQHNIGYYVMTRNRNITQPHWFSEANQ